MKIKEIIGLIQTARDVRKTVGEHETLLLVPQGTMDYLHERNEAIEASYRLAYDCVEDMAKGMSRCRYCMDRETCRNPKRRSVRGCQDWVLRFPEEVIADDQRNDQAQEWGDRPKTGE